MSGGHGHFMMRSQEGDIDEDGAKLYDQRVAIRLFTYLRPHKRAVWLALFGVLVYTLVTILIPLIIAYGLDNAITSGNTQELQGLVAIFAVLLVIHYAANYSHQMILARVGQRVIYTLRNDLFKHLQKLSMSFHNKNKVGSVMSRAQNDVYQLQEFLDIVVVSVADLLSLAGIFTIMLIMSWKLALLTMVGIPLLLVIIWFWQKHARPAFLRVRVAIARVNAALAENLDGVRVVQSMNRQSRNLGSFNVLNQGHLDTNLRAQRLASSLMPTVEIFMSFGLAATIVFGGQMVLDGTMEAGLLVAFALWIQRFFDPIRSMTMQFTQMQRAMASGVRIFDLLDVKPDLIDSEGSYDLPPIQGAIAYRDVNFSYEEGKPVLHDIELEIEAGQTVALVGRTGAGKTTMAALLSRFFDSTSGTLSIDGHDISRVRRNSLASQMGIVLQEPFQFSGTIRENIRYNHEVATDSEIEEAARAVGIHAHIVSLPAGYETQMGERGANMSLGQRQLISFARALVANPKIIILDEATANVDTQTEERIQQAIGTLLGGRTALVIAHRLSTIRNADQIVVMDRGRIAERGSHDELMHIDGIYAAQVKLHRQLVAVGVTETAPLENEFDYEASTADPPD